MLTQVQLMHMPKLVSVISAVPILRQRVDMKYSHMTIYLTYEANLVTPTRTGTIYSAQKAVHI